MAEYNIDIIFDAGDEPEPEGYAELVELCKPLSAESVASLICDFREGAKKAQERIAELEQPGFWKTEADRYFNEIVHLKDTARTNEARIAQLEAQLEARNAAVERDGDPLRTQAGTLLAKYTSALAEYMLAESGSEREQHHRKTSDTALRDLCTLHDHLIDTIRVLVRDNKAQQADLRRYKAALEEVKRRAEGFVYGKGATKMDLRQIVAHISFALSGLLEGGAE